jgi:hypothetical protein
MQTLCPLGGAAPLFHDVVGVAVEENGIVDGGGVDQANLVPDREMHRAAMVQDATTTISFHTAITGFASLRSQ